MPTAMASIYYEQNTHNTNQPVRTSPQTCTHTVAHQPPADNMNFSYTFLMSIKIEVYSCRSKRGFHLHGSNAQCPSVPPSAIVSLALSTELYGYIYVDFHIICTPFDRCGVVEAKWWPNIFNHLLFYRRTASHQTIQPLCLYFNVFYIKCV